MHKYFQLEPEVSGELGDKTILDNSMHPPKIEKLDFVFKGWLGDCLIECFPVFLTTEEVARKLVKNKINGFSIKEVEIKTGYPFDELHPDLILPNFAWIDINGIARESDFGLENNLLVVSQNALGILKSEGLNHCDIVTLNNSST